MAVAKRQGREKPEKLEQREVWGPEWGPRVVQTALLASPVYIGQAQGEKIKHIKREAKEPGGSRSHMCSLSLSPSLSLSLPPTSLSLYSLRVFWVSMSSCLEDVFSFIFKIKLSCDSVCPRAVTWSVRGFNACLSLQIFVVTRQNWGNHTLPQHL